MARGLKLEDLQVCKVSMEIGDIVRQIAMKWDDFERKTLGTQFLDAADSIAFNISEGYGRFHYRENKNFCYYSRGSAKETLTAANKVKTRKLLSEEEFNLLSQKLDLYFRLMFGYINSIGNSGEDGPDEL